MIRMWENGVISEGGEKGSPSRNSVGGGEGGRGEENPLPEPTGNDRDSVVCEGPLLTALLNKMETLLDQVSEWIQHRMIVLISLSLSLSLSLPLPVYSLMK